jgi:hypothetical protein
MSTSLKTRGEVVRAIEQCGVVAVIRLQDPQKLRGVIDALMAGGVRALEVTMTVPGAIRPPTTVGAPTRPRHENTSARGHSLTRRSGL